jgi:hypothetical protein
METIKPLFASILVDSDHVMVSIKDENSLLNKVVAELKGLNNFKKANVLKVLLYVKEIINPTDIVLILPLNITINERVIITEVGKSIGFHSVVIMTKAEAIYLELEYRRSIKKINSDNNLIIFNVNSSLLEGSLLIAGEGVIEINAHEWININEKFCATHISKILRKLMKHKHINEIDNILINGDCRYFPFFQFLLDKYPKINFDLNDNPNEKYFFGSNVKCGILSGENTNLLTLESTTYSIGVLKNNQKIKFILHSKHSIPSIKSEIVNIDTGQQLYFNVDIYEGNSKNINECFRIARFKFKNVEKYSKVKVRVTIYLGVNYNVGLQVENLKTGFILNKALYSDDFQTWQDRYFPSYTFD